MTEYNEQGIFSCGMKLYCKICFAEKYRWRCYGKKCYLYEMGN